MAAPGHDTGKRRGTLGSSGVFNILPVVTRASCARTAPSCGQDSGKRLSHCSQRLQQGAAGDVRTQGAGHCPPGTLSKLAALVSGSSGVLRGFYEQVYGVLRGHFDLKMSLSPGTLQSIFSTRPCCSELLPRGPSVCRVQAPT